MRTTAKHPQPGALTERYVHAATRRLGDDQRDDVAMELRAGVADRVDSLRADDPTLTQGQAEYAALVELGDRLRLRGRGSGGGAVSRRDAAAVGPPTAGHSHPRQHRRA